MCVCHWVRDSRFILLLSDSCSHTYSYTPTHKWREEVEVRDEKIAYDRSVLLTFFSLPFWKWAEIWNDAFEQITVITLFLIVVRKTGWKEEKRGKKSQKQRLCLWIIITHVYKGSDKTRREYLFIFKYFSSLNTLKRVTQCAFFSLQCFSGFYFALLSLFLPALLFREETFWLFHHSHFRLSARLPPLSFNLEKNEQRCWVHLSTSLLFIVLTLCSLSFLACCS